MANNRLYLKCKRTGERVMLAKYYPSTGWYVDNKTLIQDLDEMLQRDAFGGLDWMRAQVEGVIPEGGMWDGGAHELEYEQE